MAALITSDLVIEDLMPENELKLGSIIVEETDLNEIYAGPRQDVTH